MAQTKLFVGVLGNKIKKKKLLEEKNQNKHNAELQWKPPPANQSNILYTRCVISRDIIILDIPSFQTNTFN